MLKTKLKPEPGEEIVEIHLNHELLVRVLSDIQHSVDVIETVSQFSDKQFYICMRLLYKPGQTDVSGIDKRTVHPCHGIQILGVGYEVDEDSDLGISEHRNPEAGEFPNFFN